MPKLLAGQNVIVVSHGNTIHSLVKYLENIDDQGIATVEIYFGELLIYNIDSEDYSSHKEICMIDTTPTHA